MFPDLFKHEKKVNAAIERGKCEEGVKVERLENSLEGDKEKGNQGDSRVTKLPGQRTLNRHKKLYLCKQIPPQLNPFDGYLKPSLISNRIITSL